MICKNCGNEFEGKYCNLCGQKNFEERFTLKETLHNFFHAFTHVNNGILFLAKELLFKPGIVAREYIEGRRKKYFNPLQYLIIMVAIATFLAVNFNLFGPKLNPETIKDITPGERFGLQFNNFIYKFFNIILFLSVPIASLYSWLFFKKTGYNYAENLIFNTFISAQRTLIYILLTPLVYFVKDRWYIGIGIYYILWITYFSYAFIQFFGGKKYITILKFICVILLMFLTSQSLSMAIFRIFFYK